MTTYKIIDSNDDHTWYMIDGTDYGTDYAFDNEVWGIADDGRVMDCDGIPCTAGDPHEIAVRNALGI